MAATSSNDNDEPFGTTPIPTGAFRLTFDESKLDESFFGGASGSLVVAQQPQTQAFATYEASKNETLDPLITLNGSLIDVNSHFVVYALKNGLIRVLHRQSAMRALLRGHANQVVTDITFFHDGDTLATVGNDAKSQKSTLIVWRVYENPPEIGSERLLEITNLDFGGAPDLTMSRLVWHPFNPNQFWMTHSTATSKQVATLVETTRIQTKMVLHQDPKDKNPRQHAACQWHSPYCVMENALQLRLEDEGVDGQLVDLCWSGRDARHVLSVHKDGSIVLWDLKAKEEVEKAQEDSTILPQKLFLLKEAGVEHSRCMFLPHEQAVELHNNGSNEDLESITTCFVTAAETNSKITIWSAFCQKKQTDQYGPRVTVNPTKLQEICFGNSSPSSFVFDICYGPTNLNGKQNPPSSFLVLGSRDTGKLYALHIKAEWSSQSAEIPLCSGIDYMVPFSLKHPVYSWSVVCGPTQDVADDEFSSSGSGFDIKTFAYQSKAVQCLTVTSNMTLPPKNSSSDSSSSSSSLYALKPLDGPYAAAAASNEPDYEEEEYDVDEDAAEEETPSAPAAVAPAASGGLFPGAANPFANWLGAIAGGSTAAPDAKETTAEDNDDALPTPPAPSDLPMPPGIPQQGPPGIMAPPPGMVPPPTAETTSADTNEGDFLNPLELLAKSMGVDATSNDAAKEKKKNKPKTKSPRRSRSPKQKKGNKTANKSPFPDGNVTILKRAPNASPPLPEDPSVLSDPALLAAAGIPIPPTAPAVAPTVAATATIDPSVLEEQVQKAVEAAMTDMVVPAVRKSVQESFATLARPLHKSMDALSQNGVSVDSDDLKEALDIDTPLKAAFADSLKNVLVPSLQSITGQVLQQVQASMPKPPPPPKDDSKLMAALVQQLQAMTAKMDALSSEVQGLRKTVSEQAAAVAAQAEAQQNRSGASSSGSSPSQNSNNDANNELQIRNLIDVLLSKGKFEEAFTKAVATSTPQMTVYCCARSDLRNVLTDGVLSQPILICLMQQLSAALAKSQSPRELQIELAWLQEITLTLNPNDPSIVQHVPKVLRQLVQNVNARLLLEGSGHFRRPLQMLLNSLMGMQLQLGN